MSPLYFFNKLSSFSSDVFMPRAWIFWICDSQGDFFREDFGTKASASLFNVEFDLVILCCTGKETKPRLDSASFFFFDLRVEERSRLVEFRCWEALCCVAWFSKRSKRFCVISSSSCSSFSVATTWTSTQILGPKNVPSRLSRKYDVYRPGSLGVMIIALSSQRLPEEHSGTGKVFLVGRDSVPLVNSSMTRLSQSSLPTFRTHHFFKSFCSGRYLLRRGMFTCCTNSAFKGVDEMRTSFVFSGSCNRFALFLGPDGRTSNSNPAREEAYIN